MRAPFVEDQERRSAWQQSKGREGANRGREGSKRYEEGRITKKPVTQANTGLRRSVCSRLFFLWICTCLLVSAEREIEEGYWGIVVESDSTRTARALRIGTLNSFVIRRLFDRLFRFLL